MSESVARQATVALERCRWFGELRIAWAIVYAAILIANTIRENEE